MPLSSGTSVGPYEILTSLGAGGMGEVYRARDTRLDRDVALKVIHHRATPGDAIDRLLREATLASALNHPNIVSIYDTGVFDGDRYVAMELVDGITLRAMARQGLEVERVLGIARQIAEALAVAHAAQIVHRDVKPENVMVRPDGYVKLLDFGLARLKADATSMPTVTGTEVGLLVGTVGYMAPEQANGQLAGSEADIFALGVTMYELLTGRHPFRSPSQIATLHSIVWETPEPPSLVNPNVPRHVDQLVLEMMQKDPRLRPGAADVMYRLALAHDGSIAVSLTRMAVTVPRPSPTAPLVGREPEMERLLQEFDRAQRGRSRLAVVSAEAGMGKTTLVSEFVRLLEESGSPIRVGRGRCSERLAGTEAYLPMLEALETLQAHDQPGSVARLVRAIAPSWYAQISHPSSNDSSAERLAAETAGGSQERLKREMMALLVEISRIQPVVLCLDDVHWADPSTTDLLGYVARRIDQERILIVTTNRPSELVQGRHPFLSLKLDLLAHDQCREIVPGFLDEPAIAHYVAIQFPGHAFPDGFVDVISARTAGHPLFMADLLRDLRRRRVLAQVDGVWRMEGELAALERELPPSVKSLVQRKMDALEADDRRLLSVASVQGLDFDSALVAGVAELEQEDAEDRLERLEREHAIVQFVTEAEEHDRTLTLRYRFAHHVYHEAFYDSLRATRRATVSRRVAEALVARLGDQPCDCAADIALLFEAAREPLRAAEYFNRAAEAAARLYAHEDTARLAKRGLSLLEGEPETARRAAVELGLQMTYALANKTAHGYAVPEVGRAYARARELCRRVEDPARVIPVLVGMSAHHIVAGEIETSRDVALEMLELFDRLGDPNLRMLGNWALGAARFHLGELEASLRHLARGLELYDPVFHHPRVWQTGIEPGVFCRCELSRAMTLSGHPDRGLECIQEAVRQARALEHPQTLAFSLLFKTFVHLARREPQHVITAFDELSAVCTARGIAQELQWAAPLRGRARIELGEVEEGVRELQEGLAAHTLTRSALLRPYYFVMLSGGFLRAGRLDEAQRALDDSAASAEATSQRAYASEHARLQGEVLARWGDLDGADRWFAEGVRIAREQGARWLELRAARAHAHLLSKLERCAEARALLQPLVDTLTEGRDTLDYVAADALLQTLC
jgi:serine/threonine protein kinase/predicted ATPase